jgi:hypothetical protein
MEQSSRQKAMSLGWYVPSLTADGLVSLTGFCPSSTQQEKFASSETNGEEVSCNAAN